jgi:hypothetical protein
MRLRIFRRSITRNTALFNGQYIDPRALFVEAFEAIPSVTYLSGLNIDKALPAIHQRIADEIRSEFRHAEFNADNSRTEFNVMYYLLKRPCLIEIGSDFVTLYHDRPLMDWATVFLRELSPFRKCEDTRAPIGFAIRQPETSLT